MTSFLLRIRRQFTLFYQLTAVTGCIAIPSYQQVIAAEATAAIRMTVQPAVIFLTSPGPDKHADKAIICQEESSFLLTKIEHGATSQIVTPSCGTAMLQVSTSATQSLIIFP